MQLVDQLLSMLAVGIGALLVVSLIAHWIWKVSTAAQTDRTMSATDVPSSRWRVVAGLTRWLAMRLVFFWLLLLIVRLALSMR